MEQTYNFEKRRECRIFAIQYVCAYLILKTDSASFLKNLFEISEFEFTNTYAETLLEQSIAKKDESIAKINMHLKEGWTFDRLNSHDQAILLVAVYELLETDVPNKVVINEAIDIAKTYSYPESINYINAVLDKISNS